MRQAIDTAPRDGKDIILEDERSGTYDVAHWSPQAGQWLLDNGEPIKITPTHWHPMPGAASSSDADEASEPLPRRRRSEWPLRYSLFVLAAPVLVGLSFCGIGEIVKTNSVDGKRQPIERVAASKGQEPKGQEAKPGAPASDPSSDAAREDLNRIVAQLRRALDEERGRSVELAARLARAQRQIETQAAQLQQATERAALADPPEGAKSTPALEQEQTKSAALEQQISAQREEIATIRLQHRRELSDAQDALDRLHAEMRAEAMKQEALLAQAREQSGALTQEIGAKRDELASTAERNRQELEAERGRSAGVVAALATARREIEAQAVRVREANERAGGLEQAQAAVSALQEELRKQVALVAGAAAARDELAASAAQQGKELADAREAIKKLEAQRQTDIASSAELLEQERDLTATLRQQIGAAREDLTAREARGRRAVEDERARGAGIAEQLAAARREIETAKREVETVKREVETAKRQSAGAQEATATPAAAATRLIEEERDKAAALVREAVAARDELAAGVAQQARELAAAREAIEKLEAQRQADIATYAGLLEQERGQSASLTQQVGAVREEVSVREARDRKALEDERARIAALVVQLAAVQQELEAAQRQRPEQLEAIAVAARSLEEERDRTAALSREAEAARTELTASAARHRDELAAAREAVERLEARLKEDAAAHARLLDRERGQTAAVREERSAGEARQQQALEAERARGAAVAEQLAASARQLEAQAVELREAKAEGARLREAAERPAAGPPALQEGEKVAARTVGASAPAVVRDPPEPAREEVAPGAAAAAAPLQVSPEATRLIARASVLLGQGDVGSARIVLERAAQMGSAQASFMLAETYDSNVLSAWGTYGTRGDAARARQLYAHALAGGVQEARDRLNTLGP